MLKSCEAKPRWIGWQWWMEVIRTHQLMSEHILYFLRNRVFFDTAAEAFWMGMVHDLRIRIGLISAFSDLAT